MNEAAPGSPRTEGKEAQIVRLPLAHGHAALRVAVVAVVALVAMVALLATDVAGRGVPLALLVLVAGGVVALRIIRPERDRRRRLAHLRDQRRARRRL